MTDIYHTISLSTHNGDDVPQNNIGLTNELISGVEQGSFILEKLTILCLQNKVTALGGKIKACETVHVARTVS